MRHLTSSLNIALAFAASSLIACSGDSGGNTEPTPTDDTGTVIDTGSAPVDTGSAPEDTGSAPEDTGSAPEDSSLADTTPGDTAPSEAPPPDTGATDTFVPGKITVTPTSGLKTTEAGGTATFTVVLDVKPTADVTIALTSSDTKEGTVSPALLTFTATNYATAQTVTVTGVDDSVIDGAKAYKIITAAAVSTDPAYSGLNAADVDVTNDDDDKPGITVTPTSGLKTNEAGGTATFTIKLDTQPTGNVTIGLTSSDVTEGTVSPASVVFNATDWNTPKTVTITGVADGTADGDQPYKIITAPAVSTDTSYNGINPADVDVTSIDAVTPSIIPSVSAVTTSEIGTTGSFTVVLSVAPTADVTIPVKIGNAAEGTFSPGDTKTITFTSANWNVPQTVTITGVDDGVDDDDVTYDVTLGPATSTDTTYVGKTAKVTVTNQDNDFSSLAVTPTTGLVTSEQGTTATFTVRLMSQPTGTVTVPVTSGDITEGRVSSDGVTFVGTLNLTFNASDWTTPKTITVKGWDDVPAWTDGNVTYNITVGPTSSATDAKYGAGVGPTVVAVTNTDVPAPTPPSGCQVTTAAGRDYWLCTSSYLTYADAAAWCRNPANTGFRGARLPKINSSAINTALNTLREGAGIDRAWIGIKENGSGLWSWDLDGTTAFTCSPASPGVGAVATCTGGYHNWNWNGSAYTEPNNSGGAEDCAEMWGSGYWNDMPCSWNLRFFCELPGSTSTSAP